FSHTVQTIFTSSSLSCYIEHRVLHSFPTRRSSDLDLESGLKKDFCGISGDPVPGYFHPVHLQVVGMSHPVKLLVAFTPDGSCQLDRKSTRLNSSHLGISYAVFCLKKKTNTKQIHI